MTMLGRSILSIATAWLIVFATGFITHIFFYLFMLGWNLFGGIV